MKKKIQKLSVFLLTGVVALSLTGCGTLFWKERKDKSSSGEIDPTVLALDCCGLLLGIIPGVVAIVLDVNNNTMYYTKAELKAKANK